MHRSPTTPRPIARVTNETGRGPEVGEDQADGRVWSTSRMSEKLTLPPRGLGDSRDDEPAEISRRLARRTPPRARVTGLCPTKCRPVDVHCGWSTSRRRVQRQAPIRLGISRPAQPSPSRTVRRFRTVQFVPCQLGKHDNLVIRLDRGWNFGAVDVSTCGPEPRIGVRRRSHLRFSMAAEAGAHRVMASTLAGHQELGERRTADPSAAGRCTAACLMATFSATWRPQTAKRPPWQIPERPLTRVNTRRADRI